MKTNKPTIEFWIMLTMVNVLARMYPTRSTFCFAPTASMRTFSRPVYSWALSFRFSACGC